MNGQYRKMIRLLNIIQVLGLLGLGISFYAAWIIYQAGSFLDAVAVTMGPIMMSLGIMAACQLGGVLIDIAHNTRGDGES